MKILNIPLILIGLLFTSCVKDSNYDNPDYESLRKDELRKADAFEGNKITYAQLKAKASQNIETYKDNDAFEGYVISSEEAGNFYKEIYIQAPDKSGSVLVIVNKKGLYGDFPLGSKVQLRLKGIHFWNSYNTIEIGYGVGYTSTGRKKMGYLPSSMIDNVLIKTGESLPLSELATSFKNIKDLTKANNLNKLVTLKNAHFSTDAIGKTFYIKTDQYSTSHILQDRLNGKINFVTSSFAYYTNEIVPSGNFNITGILTQYGRNFQLEISNINHLEKLN